VEARSGLNLVLDWLWAAEPPAPVDAKARELALDTLGCVLAAAPKPQLQGLAARLAGNDPGAVHVPGFAPSFSVSSAAALFAAAACWDEACEGLARAHGRPGVPVIAACAALAQTRNADLGGWLRAVIAGYEVGGRMGEVLRIAPGMHVDAYWPGLGVAVAAVRLSGGSAAQALAAVRIAACQLPHSLYLPVVHGSEARNTYLAHSAQVGLLAASAALAGIDAPRSCDENVAPPGEWLLLEGYLKRFAAVRHVHYGAAAAIGLRPRIAHRLRDISRIELRIYAEALTYCANRAPALPIQAQFSLSYGLAHALVAGDLCPDAYSESALRDPLVRTLEAKVEMMKEERLTRGARVTIELPGERLEHAVEDLPAMSREEVIGKFVSYTGLPRAAAARFLDAPADALFKEVFIQA
jgi:2-methylcitrate dehydratase PrpD